MRDWITDVDGILRPAQKNVESMLHAAIDYALSLERAAGKREQKSRIEKLWCQNTHAMPICGNTAPEGQSEDIVRSMRADAGGSPVGVCGKLIEWLMAYRCLECGRWMHAECLRQHFVEHGDRLAQAERERDDYADLYRRSLNERQELARALAAARDVANAAAAFRAADQERRAYLTGECVMPDPSDAWVVARDEFRRTADAWADPLAARDGEE
jgi:hypothetical protein